MTIAAMGLKQTAIVLKQIQPVQPGSMTPLHGDTLRALRDWETISESSNGQVTNTALFRIYRGECSMRISPSEGIYLLENRYWWNILGHLIDAVRRLCKEGCAGLSNPTADKLVRSLKACMAASILNVAIELKNCEGHTRTDREVQTTLVRVREQVEALNTASGAILLCFRKILGERDGHDPLAAQARMVREAFAIHRIALSRVPDIIADHRSADRTAILTGDDLDEACKSAYASLYASLGIEIDRGLSVVPAAGCVQINAALGSASSGSPEEADLVDYVNVEVADALLGSVSPAPALYSDEDGSDYIHIGSRVPLCPDPLLGGEEGVLVEVPVLDGPIESDEETPLL